MKNSKVQLAIGIAISAVFLYFTLKPVEFDKLWVAIKTYNWWWAIPFTIVNFASLYARTIRWKYLLPRAPNLTTRRLFSPLMIGFSLNSLFPLRAGEFARAYVLAKKEKMTMSAVFATVVVERIFDMLILLVLLFIVFKTVTFDPEFQLSYGGFEINGLKLEQLSRKIAVGLFVLLAGAVFIMWKRGRDFSTAIVDRMKFLPARLRSLVTGMIHKFAEGLSSIRDIKTTIIVLVLSFAVWVLIGWSMQLGAYGFEGMRMSLIQGIAITVITCIAILIPAAPGYWGLAELGVVFGMMVLSVEPSWERALSYALITHSLQYFPILLVGLYYLWREKVSLGEISEQRTESAT